MPRKVNYGLDDDEDYDIYDDYDCGYDSEVEVDGEKTSQADHAIVKPGLWRCSICTYDNDENLSYCDICGVVRDSSFNAYNYGVEKAAPFKFDSPSPDDLVSAGKRSSGTISKAKSAQLVAPRVPSNSGEKEGTAKILRKAKGSESASVSLPNAEEHNQNGSKSSVVNEDMAQAPTSSLQNLTFDKNAKSLKKTTDTRKTTSKALYKPEPWMLPDKKKTDFCQLNLAIVGHVDSGKSTLSGRLLHLLGHISQKEMHKYEKEAKQKGKGSFAYAWALDESAEERERGITMTVAVAYFDTKKYHVVILDSPGHKDFVPNMISGATQADAAILVIDASIGSFEAGMGGSGGGQTKEHAQLIRSFGVEQIIVAVNKMDVVKYSKERFDFIKSQLGTFLRSCGFKESFVAWIPLSAIENQNLVTAASDARLSSWYRGSHLFNAIDSLQPPVREISKPLRMPICDVIKSHSLGQVVASGKLDTGAIKNGSKVLVMPYGDLATVRSMERDSHTCNLARAGDNVSVSLQGVDANHVMAGGVLCHPDFPVATAMCLELKVLTLDISMPILIGSQVEFHVHHAKEAARVVKILSVIDQKTGKVSKKAPRCLTAKQSAVIEVVVDRAVCVEEFSECKAIGRVFLRASGKTVAVGIITRIVE